MGDFMIQQQMPGFNEDVFALERIPELWTDATHPRPWPRGMVI
jgi:hypothetical protein